MAGPWVCRPRTVHVQLTDAAGNRWGELFFRRRLAYGHRKRKIPHRSRKTNGGLPVAVVAEGGVLSGKILLEDGGRYLAQGRAGAALLHHQGQGDPGLLIGGEADQRGVGGLRSGHLG